MVSTFLFIPALIGAVAAILCTGILGTLPIPGGLVGLIPALTPRWQYTFEDVFNECPKIVNQTALITGGNSGVGYETARALAKCGVQVTIACRNPTRCANAARTIENEINDGAANKSVVATMTVDTSSLGSVRNFAMEYLAKHEGASLDMLYLNAGIGGGGHLSEDGFVKLTEDGIEVVFATNYVGHHLLYRLLEPLLLDSKMARVVQVSSAASFNSFKHGVATSLQELNSRDFDPKGMKHYGQSKLAQIVWAKELTRRLGGDSSVYVNACHPGAVNTMIWDKVGLSGLILAVLNFFRGVLMWTSEEGALTQLYLGVAIDRLSNEDVRGKYFHPQAREVVNPLALDTELQRNLWTFSEDLVADFL